MTFGGNSTQDENDAFFNNYNQNASGAGTSGSLVNRVYVGQGGEKSIRLKRGRQTVTVPAGDRTKSVPDAKREYLTDANLRSRWDKILRQNGLDADPIQARAIWNMAVDGASDWYATSNGQQKITPEQYVTWYAKGTVKKKEPQVPTRQIYNVTAEQVDADIDEIAMKTLGRSLQDTDRQAEWYQDLVKGVQKLYAQGVVSEPSKLVKNKKTGQMERVVAQTPAFSKEKVTQRITEAVKEADPESLDRKQRLDFTKWLYGRGG